MNLKKYGEVFFVTSRISFIICTQCEQKLLQYDDFLNHVLQMHFEQPNLENSQSIVESEKKNVEWVQCKNENQHEMKDDGDFNYIQVQELILPDETFSVNNDHECDDQSSHMANESIVTKVEISLVEEDIISNYENSSSLSEGIEEIKLEHQIEELKEETENNGNDVTDKIICNYCGKLFEVEHFKKHKILRSCGKCPVCKCIFPNLFKHIQKHPEYKNKRQHSRLRLPLFDGSNNIKNGYSCCYCERKFTSKKFYDDHIKHHEKRLNTCKFCGKSFRLPYLLKNHLLIHTNERPYKCEICSFAFNDDSNLKDHFINKHTEGLNIKCTFENCNKVFKTQAKMKYHESYAHTGKYTNLCKECGLIFKTSGRLNNHTKKFHMKYEDRAFTCKYCAKKFAFKYELIPHEIAHAGLKPFKCGLCPKEYGTRKSFRRHCQTIHGMGPEVCKRERDTVVTTNLK